MQTELRDRVNRFIEENGVKSKFLCENLGVDTTHFCRFRQGKKILNLECSKILDHFLKSKGY